MILIVDGQNLAFAANMTQELRTSYDMPTHAVIGFMRMLGDACSEFSPTAVYVAWDGGRAQERVRLYPTYKANRDASQKDAEWLRRREDLDRQIPVIRTLLERLGVKQVWGDNVEGDDIIALIVKQTTLARPHECMVIVSSDHDFWQLVGPSVSVFNPINNGCKHKLVNGTNFKQITNLRPDQYLDYKAMVGDASDGIVGCRGVGEKTAIKILHGFGSYDAFYKAVIVDKKYQPTTLEGRAILDEDGFRVARILMDLKSPVCINGQNICGSVGLIDTDAFKKIGRASCRERV